MALKKWIRLITGLYFVIAGYTLLANPNEPDPLHKREFNVSMSETKNGTVGKKPIADKFYFKNGKLRSDFLYKKFGFKWIRYRINKDSIYTDSTDTEVRLLVIEASVTDEKNLTVLMDFTTCEWDIDGVIRITKNDKPRRYYDFAGREKGGKPKKIKKKDANPTLELVY
ncbi:hypothetical protein CNR22_18480 [Sphingobacteriaceae bacterium]|nr:hypothetical protein CNR22_18480 [Sphingobacteriaceae bacterium]